VSTTESIKEPIQPNERRAVFVTTHWSVVLSARDESSPKSAEALENLCGVYWYPLYAYARWLGNSAHDAEDLTQEFFARLLEKKYLGAVEQERGRFRTFLLVVFKRFLSEQWRRGQTQKRGGGQNAVPFDTALAESLYRNEPPAKLAAEKLYDQRWALTLLEKTMGRLRAEFETTGRGEEFERLKGVLAVSREEIQGTAASGAGPVDGAARVAAHRLRKRFRQILREEIAHTIAPPADVDEELRHLLGVLSE
jgi:DNA-directed RNA polymerase specialized sigma24 family protein